MPVFDKKAMMARFMNDEELAIKVVQVFLDDLPRQLDLLQKHLDSGDADTACRIIHSIKGASVNVEGNELANIATAAEKDARRGILGAVQAHMPAIDLAFQKLRQALIQAFSIKDIP
ncbi:Hpt domain-containing protein [Desulfobotulus sp. H1]|uniref:Hpt domain-containing protein n=1 Tax=Desulfobotulus pelophilus TaxID=2823377 RepID=A0ABT3N615_9BACT|nr:Hpt domain-containing protein [Desulfobotulus pelophilus]MCW7752906.1 Hpt domain-containing protein [Desulfobotulus pelophilus]